MSKFRRFAIYYLPSGDPLAEFGAQWLGWDAVRAEKQATRFDGLPHFHVDDVTATPRKYGFHATLKPPFRLAEDKCLEQLQIACEEFGETQAPVLMDGLSIRTIGRFLAYVPVGDVVALNAFAAACVQEFDPFRAAAPQAELERRRAAGLSPRQEELLQQWGYPYVLDEFRFHMTLSGKLDAELLPAVEAFLTEHAPDMAKPFVINKFALMGEREDGNFELIKHYALTG
ncbi:DUF1045 domain-containing protein [Maritalea porphyrae]|uniref:DUF1045 domain-containing protein n=1 Tax=Maritalea porphyrae TaxID=880732 RepID=UPI0022AF6D5B|nr:DUF1045 domain-containing protein [Maritalea porphyrae]MCZ4273383.1 DUF1045 domain-containing protein [Maritalea porphyrae]